MRYLLTAVLLVSTPATNAQMPQLVKDCRPGTAGAGPMRLLSAYDKLYYYSIDNAHGNELWVYDDADTSTPKLTYDLNPGSGDGGGVTDKDYMSPLNNKIYFQGRTQTPANTGNELFVFTPPGTSTLALELKPGTNGSEPHALITLGMRF